MSISLSVIIPTYNGERFLASALESVAAQDNGHIDLVIVDDGSSDGSLNLIRHFANRLPMRLLTPGRIGNWVAISNLGLRHASGDWACFLHQDDLWLPGRIARLWPEMETAEGPLILHNSRFIGPDGRGHGAWTCPLNDGAVAPHLFIEHLLVQNFIAIPSPVFRRTVVLESGGLDEALWFSADWDLWLRLGALGPVRFLPEILSAFRIHPASQTAARPVLSGEWEAQLTTVLTRHMASWPVAGKLRTSVERAAAVSIAVNSALSAASRGEPAKPGAALIQLLALGPAGWKRYLRDSRILQRVRSRIEVQYA
jgi:glycosyltransferase involved in cell wall biosynthesis